MFEPLTMSAAVPFANGPQFESWYKSEFGCVAFSSFESMSAQLPEDQWSVRSDSAYYRNWPVDNVIDSFFGPQNLTLTGEKPFQRQLYQSLIGQMLYLKYVDERACAAPMC